MCATLQRRAMRLPAAKISSQVILKTQTPSYLDLFSNLKSTYYFTKKNVIQIYNSRVKPCMMMMIVAVMMTMMMMLVVMMVMIKMMMITGVREQCAQNPI